LPAFCEVSGVITPVAGSRIGVVYRLPANWNGKLLGLGGGGNAGSVTLHEAFGSTIDAAEGLGSGYATAQTDAGHASPAVWDSSWAANPEAIVDFAYRAVHLMTGVGKAVTAKYYGRAHKRAYFAGCSTGGRQALMEAQRFPEDYDGVISAAPVYNLMTQSNLLVRWQVLTRQKLTRAQITQLNQAVIERCDAIDGLRDGILNDPAACQYDPTELQCGQLVFVA
jgi:feruloyl esterase